METKHTTGPWRLSETARDAVVCDSDSGHDNPDVVTCYGGHLIAESISTNANRDLIAAAPDLLDALIHCATDEGPEQEWLNKARAAIAKATGSAA